MLEKKLQEELNRYKAINKYGKTMIMEQEAPAADPLAAPADPALDAAAPTDLPPADAGMDAPTDLPPAGGDVPLDVPAPDAMGGDTEEIDITDLVNMTKSLKKDIEGNQNDHSQVLTKMDDVFTKLDDLSQKLSQMDQVMAKIDQLGSQVQQMKPKTEVEKLEMRSLDSYPFNQKPQEFFANKQNEMRASGKNEYVLTKDEIQDYTPETLRDTFNQTDEEDDFRF